MPLPLKKDILLHIQIFVSMKKLPNFKAAVYSLIATWHTSTVSNKATAPHKCVPTIINPLITIKQLLHIHHFALQHTAALPHTAGSSLTYSCSSTYSRPSYGSSLTYIRSSSYSSSKTWSQPFLTIPPLVNTKHSAAPSQTAANRFSCRWSCGAATLRTSGTDRIRTSSSSSSPSIQY